MSKWRQTLSLPAKVNKKNRGPRRITIECFSRSLCDEGSSNLHRCSLSSATC